MRALLTGCFLLTACLDLEPTDSDELEAGDAPDAIELAMGGGRYDSVDAGDEPALVRGAAVSLFQPPAGWTYEIYRDVSVEIRSSCLSGSCAPSARRALFPPQRWDEQIFGDSTGWPAAQFKWQWYAGELDPRTGNPYPSWVPIFPYFAVDFFWGCAETPGGGPVNDRSSCQAAPNQMWTTSGVVSYGAPYNTSGRFIDGYGSRPCWDLPGAASPKLQVFPCHYGPNQQFQFRYGTCSAQGGTCSTDEDCCYHGSGGCNTYSGTCRY